MILEGEFGGSHRAGLISRVKQVSDLIPATLKSMRDRTSDGACQTELLE